MNKKNLLLAIILLSVFSCKNPKQENTSEGITNEGNTKIEILNFDKSELKKIKDIKGEFKHGLKWKDSRGENLFIFTLENSFRQWDMEEEGMGDYVYLINAYHYSIDKKKYKLEKNYINITSECGFPPFELEADFNSKAFEITDIDNDGIAEISFIYYYNCSSEINPKTINLVFIDKGKPYIVRGSELMLTYYPESGQRYFGHEFRGASEEILDFVTKKWDEHYKTNPAQTKIEISSKSETLRNFQNNYESELYFYIKELAEKTKSKGLYYDKDIKKFEFYKKDKKFQQLVDHILELGYAIFQEEGRYYLKTK